MTPILKKINEIKPILVPHFIKKWFNHSDHYVNGVKCKCNITLTADGLWKITRTKCIYSDRDHDIQSGEFGIIPSGCRATPCRGSYYCHDHKGYELKFRVANELISINPNLIVKSRLGNLSILIYY